MQFKDLFGTTRPMIGMIHCKGSDTGGILDLAKAEIEIYLKYGIYPLVENYFGDVNDCEEVLRWLSENHPEAIYGVNILGNYRAAFRLAAKYGAKFVQIDSVCGHLKPERDAEYAEQLAAERRNVDVGLLGGVRFKYQPVHSGRTLEEDLRIGMERCDAIVCTGEGTGIPTPLGKVEEFKSVVGDFPVIVGAGVTLESAADTFRLSDGAIVGSWLKDTHRDSGNVCEEFVQQMVATISR